MPEWITISEAAERIKVSERTIRRYVTSGLVRGERFGPRLIRIDARTVGEAGQPLQFEGALHD